MSHRPRPLRPLSPSLLLTCCFALVSSPAASHDYWANGSSVPAWVKASCCGQADAHRLRPEQIEQVTGRSGKLAWRIHMDDGRTIDVDYARALPSQDGNYWIFCTDAKDPPVYCFFAPMDL